MTKTHWKKLQNPDYLGAYSLDDGNGKYSDITATIASVRVENIVGADGKREDCMVMRFVERDLKPMIVNTTNAKTMEKLFKSSYIEDWAGHKVQIGVEAVKAFGDVVDALRIRKFPPRQQEAPKCHDCGVEVGATDKLTAPQMVAYGQKKFGAALCADCMKKRIDAAKAAEQAQEKEPADTPADDADTPTTITEQPTETEAPNE